MRNGFLKIKQNRGVVLFNLLVYTEFCWYRFLYSVVNRAKTI